VQVELNILKNSAVVCKNVNIYFRPLVCPIWTLLQSQRGCVIRHYKAAYVINCDTLNHLQPLLKFARPRVTLVCVRRLEQEVLPDGGVSLACHQMSGMKITLISGGWQELSLSHDRRLLSRIDEHGRPLCP